MQMTNHMVSHSPVFGQNLRGTRGSHAMQNPRSPTPTGTAHAQNYYRPIQSPLTVSYSGPRPYRAPSFSPVPVQHVNAASSYPEYVFNNRMTPSRMTPSRMTPGRMTPLQPPSPAFELAPRYEYVGVPLEPPQPSNSYVIYNTCDDENALSTAEIIERQSQDYVDEQLAQFEQNTIAKLQGKLRMQYIHYLTGDLRISSIDLINYIVCLECVRVAPSANFIS